MGPRTAQREAQAAFRTDALPTPTRVWVLRARPWMPAASRRRVTQLDARRAVRFAATSRAAPPRPIAPPCSVETCRTTAVGPSHAPTLAFLRASAVRAAPRRTPAAFRTRVLAPRALPAASRSVTGV